MKNSEKLIIAVSAIIYLLAFFVYIGLMVFGNGVDSYLHSVFISTFFVLVIAFISKKNRKPTS